MNLIPLSDQKKFRLNEINKINEYFIEEITERQTISKKLNKYAAAFDYIDKTLVDLSATSGGISISLFTSVIGVSVGISSSSFNLIFSLTKKMKEKSS